MTPCSSQIQITSLHAVLAIVCVGLTRLRSDNTHTLVVVSLANTICDGLNIPLILVCVFDKARSLEGVKLRQVCWFEASGKIDCRMLPPRASTFSWHIHLTHLIIGGWISELVTFTLIFKK